MKKMIIALFVFILLCSPSNASDFEDGMAAFKAKEFSAAFQIWKPLAEQGNAIAQVYLGLMYEYGNGVTKDSVEAAKWYRKSAEQGDAPAQYRLGVMYLMGEGVNLDYSAAAKWLNKSSTQGFSKAESALYTAILQIQKQTREKIAREYPNVAVKDELVATIGTTLFKQRRIEEAIPVLIREADALLVNAQTLLEILYEFKTENVPQYDPRILALYTKKAEDGWLRFRYFLAKIYYRGMGVKADKEKAVELLIGNSSEDSLHLLTIIFLESKDFGRMEKVLKIAIQDNYSWAYYNYGVVLKMKGAHAKAMEHFQKTLELKSNDYSAMINLGQGYVEGWGVKADPEKGFLYYKKAADEGGLAETLYVTGALYLDGKGVKASKGKAIYYLEKAADKGFKRAKKVLEQIKSMQKRIEVK